MSAQLGTLPFILYYFGSFPTYFLLANLVVVILAGVILVLTFAALCLASVPIVGNTVITLLEWGTLILNKSMQEYSNWPVLRLLPSIYHLLKPVCWLE